MKTASRALLGLLALTQTACQHSVDAVSLRNGLANIYQDAVNWENGDNIKTPPNPPGDVPLAWQGTAGIYSANFWREYANCQNIRGRNAALSQLKDGVNRFGLCMIMDSETGRNLVGSAEFDPLMLSNKGRQTYLFRLLFGNGWGDFLSSKSGKDEAALIDAVRKAK